MATTFGTEQKQIYKNSSIDDIEITFLTQTIFFYRDFLLLSFPLFKSGKRRGGFRLDTFYSTAATSCEGKNLSKHCYMNPSKLDGNRCCLKRKIVSDQGKGSKARVAGYQRANHEIHIHLFRLFYCFHHRELSSKMNHWIESEANSL